MESLAISKNEDFLFASTDGTTSGTTYTIVIVNATTGAINNAFEV